MRLFAFATPVVAAMVSLAAPAAAPAMVPTTMSCSQPYGVRGQTIPFTVTLRENGVPLANQPVVFSDWSDNRPNAQIRGTVWTNGDGRATLYYTIPTNPAEDNVYVQGVYTGNATYSWSFAYARVAIGHRYP